MSTYTLVFGSGTILPSGTSYLALTIAANATLEWPIDQVSSANILADILDITASTTSLTLALPDATKGPNGKIVIVNNLGANTFTVVDTGGNTVQAVASGEIWSIYLADNSTANGTWRSLEFGAGTSSASAASLVGAGIKAVTTTLNQKVDQDDKSSSPYTVDAADRARLINWTGGAGTFDLTAAATLAADWFCLVRNSGSGDLTIDPNGAELIDAAATITLPPLSSTIVVCDGSAFVTVGNSVNTLLASTTAAGRIEIATDAEAIALSSSSLAIVPSNLKDVIGITKRKTADETTNTDTAMSTDADLAGITLVIDSHYLIEGLFLFNVANGTMGFKWDLIYNQTEQESAFGWDYWGTLLSAGVLSVASQTGLTSTQTQVPTGSGNSAVFVKGYIHSHLTVADTLEMRWAQSVSDGSNLTLLKGSYLHARRIA